VVELIPHLVAAVVALSLLAWMLWLFWQGPPYLPSKDLTIEEMVRLAKVKQGTRVAELGSGDGRLAIALAKAGAQVDGYEINPYLAWRSKRNVRRAGMEARVKIYRKNFWKVDFSGYQAVTTFGIPHIMERLGTKLARELPAGARVVSNAFPIPGLPKGPKTKRAFTYIIAKR
jgi:hypothetical protein